MKRKIEDVEQDKITKKYKIIKLKDFRNTNFNQYPSGELCFTDSNLNDFSKEQYNELTRLLLIKPEEKIVLCNINI
jgi:hypothetical protein